MTADLKPISKKLSQIIRLLASDQPGEIVAAAAAMRRALATQKLDLNDFADHVEAAKRFTDEEAQELVTKAMELGRQKAHAEMPATFHSVKGEPSWHEIAVKCSQHPEIMKSTNEEQFVDDMVRRTVHGGEPTEKQGDWLRKIYTRIRK